MVAPLCVLALDPICTIFGRSDESRLASMIIMESYAGNAEYSILNAEIMIACIPFTFGLKSLQ